MNMDELAVELAKLEFAPVMEKIPDLRTAVGFTSGIDEDSFRARFMMSPEHYVMMLEALRAVGLDPILESRRTSTRGSYIWKVLVFVPAGWVSPATQA